MKRLIYIPLFICLLAIAIFVWVGLIISSVWLFVPATLLTLFVYLNGFYKRMPDPGRILPLYLLALSIQMLHFAEEYLTGFVVELPKLLNQEPYPEDFWLVFNMAAYAFFILGGIILFKQIRELAVIPLFFILVGVFLNPLAHIGLALYSGDYFPGLYTALAYLLLIPSIIQTFFTTSKGR